MRVAARHGLALVAACSLIAPAPAEKADRDKPITITADKSFADEKSQVSVFEGAVIITQGTLRVTADRVELRRDKESFDNATATGNPATFRQKRDGADEYIEGWARRIEYSGKTELVELIDRARIKRGNDEITANYITYNSQSEVFQASNPPSGKGGTPAPGERVRAVIQPKPKEAGAKPGVPAPAELKPATGIGQPQ